MTSHGPQTLPPPQLAYVTPFLPGESVPSSPTLPWLLFACHLLSSLAGTSSPPPPGSWRCFCKWNLIVAPPVTPSLWGKSLPPPLAPAPAPLGSSCPEHRPLPPPQQTLRLDSARDSCPPARGYLLLLTGPVRRSPKQRELPSSSFLLPLEPIL